MENTQKGLVFRPGIQYWLTVLGLVSSTGFIIYAIDLGHVLLYIWNRVTSYINADLSGLTAILMKYIFSCIILIVIFIWRTNSVIASIGFKCEILRVHVTRSWHFEKKNKSVYSDSSSKSLQRLLLLFKVWNIVTEWFLMLSALDISWPNTAQQLQRLLFVRILHSERHPLSTVYPKKYAHGFCFAVFCCGYTLTDFPISIRLTSLALWQSNDCPSASKATLMNLDKYFMWIHYERLHNHNKAKHNKTVCIFLGIYCSPHRRYVWCLSWIRRRKVTTWYRKCVVVVFQLVKMVKQKSIFIYVRGGHKIFS